MAYVGYEAVTASSSVKTVSALTIPGNATFAEIQAETQNVRYTLDGTNPTTTSGMLLHTGLEAKLVMVDVLRDIKFIRDGGSDATLNIHYGAGRDV